MKSLLLAVALVVFAAAVTLAVAKAQWRVGTATAVARLNAAAPDTGAGRFEPVMLAGLPAPVARYLRAAIRDGASLSRRVVVRHEGGFRADSARAAWSPFRSVQHFTSRAPGFVWAADIRMSSLVPVYVRDELIAGSGAMRARLLGLVPVADAAGTPALASGALHRWLAEAVWFPTALLPSAFLHWSAVDDSTALATATAGGTTVSLAFRFRPDSLVRFVETPARMRDVNGEAVPTPWRVTLTHWHWRGDVRVPMRGEVTWDLPSGPWTYWRGRITDATYD